MTGGGGQELPSLSGGGGQELPSLNGGEFLLRLVQGRQHQQQQLHRPQTPSPPLQTQGLNLDPAVAAVGPTIPLPLNAHHYLPPPSLSPPNAPNFFLQGFPQNPTWPQQMSRSPPLHLQFNNFEHQEQSKLLIGKMPFDVAHGDEVLKNSRPLLDLRGKREVGLGNRERAANGLHQNWGLDRHVDSGVRSNDRVYRSPEIRQQPGPPPGFSGQPPSSRRQGFDHSVSKGSSSSSELSLDQRGLGYGSQDHGRQKRFGGRERSNGVELGRQLDHPGPPSGSTLHSVTASEIEESLLNAHALVVDNVDEGGRRNGHGDEMGDLGEQLVESLVMEDEADGKSEKKKQRDKDFRSDPRGGHTLSQRMRNMKSYIHCRNDIHRHNARFLELYESLIPAEEEKAKQRQLLSLLEKLVKREWPNAKLYLYGSCANSFGVSKSDIDVCLAIADQDINKSEIILKLADILQSDSLENVQALTRARVPIVKLKDPVTGVNCDICVNNLLAVVNTKLLRDYAEIDTRLRQLAFIVKHWAKSRGVNETYQGTLSSYAYVLMCIHFLQQRRPAILPCLQGMEATYAVTVDNAKYVYFDQVERLRNFGARNKESIAQLVWSFFNYWAYCHDYANSVISIRTGSYLSKHEKDWTRRVGNERHLICIEDPFETSHDLGRVVDKHSIRVLREEFERAAEVLQHDPNPCVELFRPYVPS